MPLCELWMQIKRFSSLRFRWLNRTFCPLMEPEVGQSESMLRLWNWILDHQQRIINGILAAVAVGLAGYAYLGYQTNKEIEAGHAASKVSLGKFSEVTPPAELAAGYLKVAQEHAGTAAASQVLLRAANALYADSKFSEAEAQFRKFISQNPASPFAGVAAYGIGACLDASGKTAEAAAQYDEVTKRYSSDPIVEEARLALANSYVAQNKPELAYKLYQEIMESGKAGNAMQEIFTKRTELLQKYPYLQSNNVPARPVTPASLGMPAAASNAVTKALSNAAPAKP